MLSAGLRLVLAAAAPVVGAALVHELRRFRMIALAVTCAAIATCAVLAVSLRAAVAGGGSLERSFGEAIPGIDLTARADSASIAAIVLACLAALLAAARHRGHGERLTGLLLCLGGTVVVASAGNLALGTGGVEAVAAGALLLRGQRGPGARSSALLAGLLCVAALALTAAAAQLVAAAGSSDLAFVPQGAVGGALAIPWALAGAALLLSPAIPGEGGSPARDWAAVGALPCGYLILLRLHQSAGGQLPGNAAAALAVVGGLVACLGAFSALRARTLAAAGRAVVAILAGVLVSFFGTPLAQSGTVVAGLFLAIEVSLLAAPSWNRRPTGWSAASLALTALPGGAAFVVTAAGLASIASRGVSAFPQLLLLSGVLAAAAMAGARALVGSSSGWRPSAPGAVLATAAGLAGGFLPGLALRLVAAPLAGGASAVDLDAGAIALPGGGFAGGYFAVAAAILLAGAVAAIVLAGDGTVSATAAHPRPLRSPPLRPLLRLRRSTAPAARRAAALVGELDAWLECQPQVALFVVAAALAVLVFR